MTGAPALAARGIRRSFPEGFSLRVEDFAVEAGSICGFTGPNGAGKTVLLEILGLVEPPDEGGIELLGRRIFPGPVSREERTALTFVMQRPYLFRGTVAWNVGYGLAARGLAGPERKRRVDACLERFGLGDLAGADVRRLSGGEARWVAIARGCVLEPAVLILDEPDAHLDEPHVEALDGLIRGMRGSTTVLFSTHDPARTRICDHVFALDQGAVQQAR
ncbi:MAG: ABC transporter ATP-binding protein [Candidatus Coatesbacteria bacterium]